MIVYAYAIIKFSMIDWVRRHKKITTATGIIVVVLVSLIIVVSFQKKKPTEQNIIDQAPQSFEFKPSGAQPQW